jgi:DNA (cytosine-5)-methyltransferase 1
MTVSDDREASFIEPPNCQEESSAITNSVVSFFAGCGGMDLGFEGGFEYRNEHYGRLPFHVKKAYEIDKACKATYEKNLGHRFELCDLAKADVKLMPQADVLIGGFPCQEFSICGPKGGTNSKRGALFRAMSRYAKHWKPLLVVGENVAHLPRLNGGADYAYICRSFARAGYRAALWRVYAPDYGVPQARERVILLFIRNDIPIDPLPPRQPYKSKPRSVKWAIDDLKKVRDNTIANQDQFFKAGLAKTGHGQGDEISPENAPGYTVRANARSRIQFHYSLKRRLTVRECARLQTFPDSFEFPHPATTGIRQIGNAVPPVLAYELAKSLSVYLKAPEVVAANLPTGK